MVTDDHLLCEARNDALLTLLAPFGPRLPLAELVYQVNQLFHACEARDYDRRHAEIHEQLPALWRQLIGIAAANPPDGGWTILDFGCGTGFAATQLLQTLPAAQIRRLVCFDPSPEMLERCRAKLGRFGCVEFTSDFNALANRPHTFNLLATNSVLHHLPDPFATISALQAHLDVDCVWLAGHEPSRRFYANPECRAALKAYRREEKWRGLFSPRRYVRRWREFLGLRVSPARATARLCVRHGLFAVAPTPGIIDRLVDFHVPHGSSAPEGGFDVDTLQQGLGEAWRFVWQQTYSFLGRYYEATLPRKWAQVAARLRQAYPHDGANFCSAWRFHS